MEKRNECPADTNGQGLLYGKSQNYAQLTRDIIAITNLQLKRRPDTS